MAGLFLPRGLTNARAGRLVFTATPQANNSLICVLVYGEMKQTDGEFFVYLFACDKKVHN